MLYTLNFFSSQIIPKMQKKITFGLIFFKNLHAAENAFGKKGFIDLM